MSVSGRKMTHVRASTPVLALLLSVAMVTQPRSALAEVAGHLARVFGDVRVDEVRANTGDTFESGATISTGSRAFSVLKFTDGQVVALRAESVLSVDDYMYAANNLPDSRAHTSLLEGGMRALTGVIGQENPEAVSFNTPVATIGIRGTEMVIGVQTVSQTTAAEVAEEFIDLAKCFSLILKVQLDEVEVRYPQDISLLTGLPKVSRCEDLTDEDLRTLIEQLRQAAPANTIVVVVSEGQSFGFVEGQQLPGSEAEALIESDDSPVKGLDVDMQAFQLADDTAQVDNAALPREFLVELAAAELFDEPPTPVTPAVGPISTQDAGGGSGGGGGGVDGDGGMGIQPAASGLGSVPTGL